MKTITKSILTELSSININRNPFAIIETKGINIIESAINLLNLVREQYDESIADDLERRFIISIKTKDSAKFKRSIKKVQKERKM